MSHDTPTAGFDPLAAPPREGDGVVKWPILAQLPWVGEPLLREEVVTPPVDILPFAEPAPEPYKPPTFHESEAFSPQFRIVDPALPLGEELAAPEPLDRRLHRATPAGRPVAEPPHLSLHRFPTAPTVAVPAIEPQRPPIGESPTPRQHRRFDPPQPRYGEGLALHHPNESLAAQLYQWQAVRKPQTALIAMSLLLMTAGGLYLFTIGRPAAEPKEIAAPPAWEIQPLTPAAGAANETLATPLPANPTLDLSTGSPVGPTPAPAANEPPPMSSKAGIDAEDPIAAWLNDQPQLPQLTASKDAAEFPSPVAKSAETTVEKPVLPAPAPAVAPQPATVPATDQSITPTPTLPSLTLTSPYQTTPYPPFPATLALPPSNAWPPAVAETLSPTFDPPKPPRWSSDSFRSAAMSAIDQAFIRAYQLDETEPTSSHRATAKATVRVATIQQSKLVESIAVQAVAAAVAQPQVKPVAAAVRPMAPPPIASSKVVEPHGTSQRRPLSTFAQPSQIVEARFKPALEVDSFRWSMVSQQLIQRCRQQLQPAVETILAADDAGRSLLGVGAQSAGAGCTTLVACLARLLVEAGKTVAIVDANFAKPGLATHLGLAAEIGWEDVLSGRVSLAEAVVHSLGDRVSLLPLAIGGPAAASRLETIHASVTAGVLRYHYDIVLFDLGVVADPQQGPIARRVIQQCRLDGALVASGRGAAAAQPQQLLRSAPELATICLGVVENQLRAA